MAKKSSYRRSSVIQYYISFICGSYLYASLSSCDSFRRRRSNSHADNTITPIAATPRTTPTPTPALAPDESPGSNVGEVAAAAVGEVGVDVIELRVLVDVEVIVGGLIVVCTEVTV